MPIYEYRREDGTTFEVMQSITDDPLTRDPETGQAVQRVFHAPAVHFKGSGFYNTDYGTRKRNREKDSSSTSGGDGGKSSSTKSSDGASSSSSGSGDKATSSSSSSSTTPSSGGGSSD